jgi:hypothetical protein
MRRLVRSLLYLIAVIILIGIGLLGGVLLAQRGLLGLLGISSEPSINITVVLERVQALAELTTTRYNFSSIVTSERDMPQILQSIYGDRQVLVAVGSIEAGVDLAQLEPASFEFADSTLTVNLPAAALLACALDETKTYVMQRDTGIFAPNAPNLDSDARRFALRQFRDQALESGILGQAETEARAALTGLLLATNPAVERVVIHFALRSPDALLPDSCA